MSPNVLREDFCIRNWASTTIRLNDDMLDLTGMWRACGEEHNKRPQTWLRSDTAAEVMLALKKKLKSDARSLLKTEKGRYGGTWAHPTLGLAYAEPI